MEIRYKTKKLEKSLTTDNGLLRTYGRLAKKIKQRMQQLKSAENLETIQQLSVLRLHSYKGKEEGIWSIDIQENWRILFRLENDPIPKLADGGVDIKAITIIKIISIMDPH